MPKNQIRFLFEIYDGTTPKGRSVENTSSNHRNHAHVLKKKRKSPIIFALLKDISTGPYFFSYAIGGAAWEKDKQERSSGEICRLMSSSLL